MSCDLYGNSVFCLFNSKMTELLKEQIYHSNIINGMSTSLPACHHFSSEAASDARTSRDNLLLDRIASLEKKMEEQSRTVEVFLSGALKQVTKINCYLSQSFDAE